jgi:very-short-patch-repair endonuclease
MGRIWFVKTHLPSTLKRAREQRQEMSLPEVLLWMQLKQRPGGWKFRHLHPFGNLVADFYCDKAKLVVEVDGESHNRGDQPAFDEKRDAYFLSHGIRTLRIPARDILSNMDGVIQYILVAADAAGPPPSAFQAATSPDGGGFALEQ